jgi:hypothetical protein
VLDVSGLEGGTGESEEIELSQGEFDTRRLEPRRYPWERK